MALCNQLRMRGELPIPATGTLLDVTVDVATGEWQTWESQVPAVDLMPQQVQSTDVVVTTGTFRLIRHRSHCSDAPAADTTGTAGRVCLQHACPSAST